GLIHIAHGQREADSRALPLVWPAEPDPPALRLDDPLANGQAQPRAGGAVPGAVLCLVERLEDPPLLCRGDTRPLVAHVHPNRSPVVVGGDGDLRLLW